MNKIIYIIGVSGCGKSTIGKLLSEQTKIPFFDGDDFHPKENIEKMSSGNPLNDIDREGWLKNLNSLSKKELKNKGAIIACSALKESYRNTLSDSIKNHINWILLMANKELILKRMSARNHFMPTSLLQSQFDALETPDYGLHVSVENSPKEIITTIIKAFHL